MTSSGPEPGQIRLLLPPNTPLNEAAFPITTSPVPVTLIVRCAGAADNRAIHAGAVDSVVAEDRVDEIPGAEQLNQVAASRNNGAGPGICRNRADAFGINDIVTGPKGQ